MFEGMNFKEWFSVLTSLVGIIVIPFTLVGIWRSRVISQEADNWKARQEEIGTYNDINTKYADFLNTLLLNSDVDIGEFQTPREVSLDVEKYKRNLMYAMLVSLMERAFLLYTAIDRFDKELVKNREVRTRFVIWLDNTERFLFGQHPKQYETHVFKTQWPGWVKYFEYYCRHKAFQEYWTSVVPYDRPSSPTQWQDTDFEQFINDMIEKITVDQQTDGTSPSAIHMPD